MIRLREEKMRTFHIWVKNKKTNEVKCKLVKRKSFASAASDAYLLVVSLRETTHTDWDIMSLNDTNFSHNPKVPIV
jgi:hypothetical protein